MDEWNALNPAAHATLHALQPIMMMMTIMLMMIMVMIMIMMNMRRKRRMKSTFSKFLSLLFSVGSRCVNLKAHFSRPIIGQMLELGNFGIMKTVTFKIMGPGHFSSFIFRPSAPNVPLNLL